MVEKVINAREAAQRLGVAYSTVRLWIKTRQLKATKQGGEWVVPAAEIERLLADLEDYNRKHATKILAAELLVEKAGTHRGQTLRACVNTAQEIVRIGREWGKRARAGASHETNAEISQTLRSRIALLAALDGRIRMLDQVLAVAVDILPRDPRRALVELSIRVGGLEPAEAQRIVAGLSDEQVQSRLEELPVLVAGDSGRVE